MNSDKEKRPQTYEEWQEYSKKVVAERKQRNTMRDLHRVRGIVRLKEIIKKEQIKTEELSPKQQRMLKGEERQMAIEMKRHDAFMAKKLEAMEKKAARMETIIEMRQDGYTLKEIGEKFGVSRERIRQIGLQSAGYPRRVGGDKLITLECGWCKKSFSGKRYKLFWRGKFRPWCDDPECKKRIKHNGMSDEEWKEFRRLQYNETHRLYMKNVESKKPGYKEKVRLNNLRAYAKKNPGYIPGINRHNFKKNQLVLERAKIEKTLTPEQLEVLKKALS